MRIFQQGKAEGPLTVAARSASRVLPDRRPREESGQAAASIHEGALVRESAFVLFWGRCR